MLFHYRQNLYEMVRFDFMVGGNLKVYLLEVSSIKVCI